MEEGIEKIQISRHKSGRLIDVKDDVAIEAPLEIQIKRAGLKPKSISVTMRTPGDDEELALGFLFNEGILSAYSQVKAVSYERDNIIKIHVSEDFEMPSNSLERNFYTTSSCGVCGKASIEAIHTKSCFNIKPSHVPVSEILFGLKDKLTNVQSLFTATGGIHAAALFNLEGQLLAMREDVGRHNALDKLIGHGLKSDKLPYSNTLLLLSGRASFELVQKATMAAMPIVVSVGAPSSLAVELARDRGIKLIGFLKSSSYNIYS